MKRVLAIILAAMLLLAMAACTEPAPVEPVDTFDYNQDVELTMWAVSKWSGINGTEADGQPGDWERYMADQFSAKNPNVKINVEIYDTQAGPTTMASAIAAEETPDVVHDASTRLMLYSNSGFLVPVTEYLSEDDIATFAEGTFESVRIVDGNSYFVPFGTNTLGIMVNLSLFEQADCLDLLPQGEDRTWTFDEYYTAVTTAMEKLDGVYGVPLFADVSTGGDMYTWCWMYSAGGKMFDAETNKMGCNTKETKTGLEFWKKLIDEGISAPGGAALNAGGAPTIFYQQQVLTCPCATIQYSRLVKGQENGTYNQFDVGVYAMPHAEGAETISCADPHGFAVWQNEDPLKLYWAKEFVKFLSSDENAEYIKAAGEVSYKNCAQDLYVGEDENFVFMGSLMNRLVPSGNSVPGYTTARFEVTPYYQQLYLGEISIDEFCESVESVCNTYLENYEA